MKINSYSLLQLSTDLRKFELNKRSSYDTIIGKHYQKAVLKEKQKPLSLCKKFTIRLTRVDGPRIDADAVVENVDDGMSY